jgi:hypothetical protein
MNYSDPQVINPVAAWKKIKIKLLHFNKLKQKERHKSTDSRADCRRSDSGAVHYAA